jgi:hypothetical protein
MQKDLSIIKDTLNKYNYIGIRGLNGINANKKYRNNQILKKSFDLWDARDCEYINNIKLLGGTSAIEINSCMDDNEILEAIDKAMNYSDCNKLCLIAGKYSQYGYDNNEIVISNGWSFGDQGARFICYL